VVAAGATSVTGLMVAAMLAGLGNAPFHPIDFSVLNQRVSTARLGYAFSAHGIAGNLGWAATPVFIGVVFGLTHSWRAAVLGMAIWALLVLGVLYLKQDSLNVPVAAKPASSNAQRPDSIMHFLKLPNVWLCFSFFFFSTCALCAIQSFAAPALGQIYGLALTDKSIAFVVSGYMIFGAFGMLVGGVLAARLVRLERGIAACLLFSALLLLLSGFKWGHAGVAVVLIAVAGFGAGLAAPSRDMLVKQAAPPGATGRVYGLVYSGLDLGFALAAPLFALMLDGHWPAMVFVGAALSLVLGVCCAAWVGVKMVHEFDVPAFKS
jgi:MFS transporter, FSR family, fosmidomycin resistance protein